MTSGRDGSDTSLYYETVCARTISEWVCVYALERQMGATKAIPALSANGTWAVSFIRLTDLQGNRYTYYEPELIQNNVNTKYQVVSALCMTAPWLCPEYKQLKILLIKMTNATIGRVGYTIITGKCGTIL